MFPVLRIGPLALQTAGLVVLLAFWLALELASRQGARQGFRKETVHNAGFYGALVGILAARLGYAAVHWPAYSLDPLGLIALSPQALHPAAGLVAGGMVAILYLRRRGAPVKPILDMAAPGLAVFMGLLALADLAGGQGLGEVTTVPWGIAVWDELRHPVQLYELLFWVLAAALIWRAGTAIPAPGLLFLLFIVFYGAAGVLIEPFRAQSMLTFGGLRAMQVMGLVALPGALWLMRAWWRRSMTPMEQNKEGMA
jgi:phosphatidylglycerol---prolipoprotein diacylglyceryl transferase